MDCNGWAGKHVWSLSSWRAWIEILRRLWKRRATGRSPHGERGLKSAYANPQQMVLLSRSPHGERGLKLFRPRCNANSRIVALLMESVD